MTFNNNTFDESKHPRDNEGKFTYAGGCSSSKSNEDRIRKEREEKARMQRAADILYPTMKDNKNGGMCNINKGEIGKLGGDVLDNTPTGFGANIHQNNKNTNTYSKNEDYKETHDICKEISIGIYNEQSQKTEINGFKKENKEYKNKETGFHGQTYVNPKTKEIIVAYEGTNILSGKDLYSDAQMYKLEKPKQLNDAENMYKEIKDKYPNHKIIFTGHSLGGSLAQLMGTKYGNETVTFNAYGIGSLSDVEINSVNNIINYGHKDDKVFNNESTWHVGKVICTNANDNVFSKVNEIKNHKAENIGDLKRKIANPR